jgi:hypothetical protein
MPVAAASEDRVPQPLLMGERSRIAMGEKRVRDLPGHRRDPIADGG